MAWGLSRELEDLSPSQLSQMEELKVQWDPKTMVAHTFDPSTSEGEWGGFLWVRGWSGEHSEYITFVVRKTQGDCLKTKQIKSPTKSKWRSSVFSNNLNSSSSMVASLQIVFIKQLCINRGKYKLRNFPIILLSTGYVVLIYQRENQYKFNSLFRFKVYLINHI